MPSTANEGCEQEPAPGWWLALPHRLRSLGPRTWAAARFNLAKPEQNQFRALDRPAGATQADCSESLQCVQ